MVATENRRNSIEIGNNLRQKKIDFTECITINNV